MPVGIRAAKPRSTNRNSCEAAVTPDLECKMRQDFDQHFDVEAVIVTANLLERSEYQVFEIAYAQWYQNPAPADELENCFVRYIFHQQVPPWVRAFTRAIAGRQVAHRRLNYQPLFNKFSFYLLSAWLLTRRQEPHCQRRFT